MATLLFRMCEERSPEEQGKTGEAFASSSSVTRAGKGDGVDFLTVDLLADTERIVIIMGPLGAAGTPLTRPLRQ